MWQNWGSSKSVPIQILWETKIKNWDKKERISKQKVIAAEVPMLKEIVKHKLSYYSCKNKRRRKK